METTLVLLSLAILSTLLSLASSFRPCPPCGAFLVPYPLSTEPDCGVPGYKLHCNNQVLKFQSIGGTYHKILSIDPIAHKLIISPPSVCFGSCLSSDLAEGGLIINETSPFNISNRNTVMLLNCSETLLLSPLNCSSNSICRKFEEVDGGIGCRNTLCCSYLKDSPSMSHQIRVRVGACTAYTSVVGMDESQPPSSWKIGIELQWLPLA